MYGVEPKSLSIAGLDIEPSEIQGHYFSVIDWIKEMQLMEGLVNQEVNGNLDQARKRMKNGMIRVKLPPTSKEGNWFS